MYFFEDVSFNLVEKICQKWDSNPRPHTRTRTLYFNLKQGILESGALDHSAILTHTLHEIFSLLLVEINPWGGGSTVDT